MQATRQRIVEDLARAVTALKGAAGEVRDAVVRPAAAKSAKSTTPARRGRKTPARTKSRAKVKVKAKSKAKARA